jgi:RNA polymerase sigma-70 factor (ECF subfamily)
MLAQGRPAKSGLSTKDEFAALYDHDVDVVYRYVARRLGPDLGEELTAQTFAEAWAGRDRFDPDRGSARSWLLGIATNLVRRHHRAETRQLRAYTATGVDPAATFDDVEVLDRLVAGDRSRDIARALSELSTTDRDILYLTSTLSMTYAQVSQVLDLPIGTVRSRLSRARRRLESRLDRADHRTAEP